MAIYTVHEPLPRKGETSASTDRFALVRDGFYFWAFVLGPLWMLWRRLWLVTVFYFVIATATQVGLWAINAGTGVKFFVWFLLALLIGFEAGTLRRWTLTRRGWRNVGVVVGEDVETAERRFFAAWTPRAAASIPPSVPPPARPPVRPGENQVIGLFPSPGARR